MKNLEWFASRLEKASHGSGYVMARCIFHDDNNPSLVIYEDSRRFFCFGCGKGGTWDYLEASILKRHEIKTWRRSWSFGHHEGRKPSMGKISKPNWPHGDLHKYCRQSASRLGETKRTHTYLDERGLGLCIRQFGLGWDNGWYIIPVRSSDGSIQGAVARIGPRPGLQKSRRYDTPYGQKPMLYVPDWEIYNSADRIYLVFGVLDAISLACVGLPGCSPTAGNMHIDTKWFDDVNKMIYIVPDKKEEKVAYRHAKRLDWRGKVLMLNYGPDEKDINDILVGRGIDGLRRELGDEVD